MRTLDQFRETEVEHLHRSGARDHHVARLDVAVHDAAIVRGCERVSYLNRDRERAAQIEWLTVDNLAHVSPFDELHCDELSVANFVQTEDRADVWMIERRRELGFTFETYEVGSAVSEIRRQDLYDCGPIERRIEDLVNSTLSALADFFDDTIMEEELPEHRRKGIEPARAYSG